MSASDKSRQSSGGKSFFSRNRNKDKDKDKRFTSDEGRHLASGDNYDTGSIAPSTLGSRSSRHNRDSSIVSVDRAYSDDGLSPMAGVMTSIPYDSVPADLRSPISVDYLPKPDQAPVRRELLPHQLNKATSDFHQYPNIDPSAMQGAAGSHLSAARPSAGPGGTNITMATTGRQTMLQQWGPGPARSSVASTVNGAHNPRYDSYMTSAGRNSADHSSVFSGNGGTHEMTAARSSKLALPSASSQSSFSPHQSYYRDSHRLTKFPGMMSAPPTGGGHESFYFPKPDDDHVIDQIAALPEPQTNLDDPRPRNRFAHPNPPLTVPLACRSLTRFALTQSETQNTAQPTTHFHTHPTRPRQPLGELEVNPTHASYLLLPPRKAASLLVDSPRLPARPTPIMRPASACLLAPSSRPAQA
ncbi:hypothetical protein BN1723_011169 [Verticillium longisporum]|uniref:Uncharacterized protein n=1 Tax=Verticillium longisporum TaxID=100787 RepID=A0A0G4L4N7_VERLO|nr:hypothetical protein BN1723_011169 [Verticillium longisporum]